jgi:hypothetical protein
MDPEQTWLVVSDALRFSVFESIAACARNAVYRRPSGSGNALWVSAVPSNVAS